MSPPKAYSSAPASSLEAQARGVADAPLEAHLVAEEQVVAVVAVDRVAGRAADQHVVARAALDAVGPPSV